MNRPAPWLMPTVALAMLLMAPHTAAQRMYKCGNTYSQTPCASDAKPTRLHTDAVPDKAQGATTGMALCAATAKRRVKSPEPDTMRVEPAGERVSQVIQYAGQAVAAHRYELTVDAKTSYGVFSGPVGYVCWLSEDQARVLQFERQRGG